MENNKKILKTLLKEMYKLAERNDKRALEIADKNFAPLFEQTFKERSLTEEAIPYDRARNNIKMSFSEPISAENRKVFLNEAKKYLDML